MNDKYSFISSSVTELTRNKYQRYSKLCGTSTLGNKEQTLKKIHHLVKKYFTNFQ